MAIVLMCGKDEPGAYESPGYPGKGIYVQKIAEGAVVALREMNGYDDSDFYATYYDPESDSFKEIMYATTRGWTYAAGAAIDATVEVAAKYEAYLDAQYKAAKKRAAELEAKKPRKGKRCRILAKRGKAAKFAGQVGEIFWTGERRSAYGTWSYGTRVGVDVNGERVFVNEGGIEVVAADEECSRI